MPAELTPWWGKVAAKVVLSRFPVSHRVWKRLGLFRQGAMEEPGYAHAVFVKHFQRVRPFLPKQGFVGLELGPGESLFSAVIAKAMGASLLYLVDVQPYAETNLTAYRRMAAFLEGAGIPAPDLSRARSFEEMLDVCGAIYKTSGLQSLQEIPTGSVDYVWSHAVLQHVKRSDFVAVMQEVHRILRGNGVCSHVIDFRDCIAGGLNNLRFQEGTWEAPIVAEAGLYTNRMRFSEMMAVFRQAGFEGEVLHLSRWDRLPIAREKLSEHFRAYAEDELKISGCEVLLKPV